jgi:hypothetical protein
MKFHPITEAIKKLIQKLKYLNIFNRRHSIYLRILKGEEFVF